MWFIPRYDAGLGSEGGSRAHDYIAGIIARSKEQKKYTAYRLHRLGWTMEEIGHVLNLAKSRISEICSEFPELEKTIKNLLSSGLSHAEIAQRFGMSPILVWAVDMDGRDDAERMEKLGVTLNDVAA